MNCRKCQEDKPTLSFYTRKHSRGGRNQWCIQCCNEYKRAWRLRRKTPLVIPCPWCGREFEVRRHKKACTPECRYRLWYRDVHLVKHPLKPKEFKFRRFVDELGYVGVRSNGTLKREHAIKAEAALGRPLKKGEVVHHINGIKTDNRNTNLLICTSQYHKQLHHRMCQLFQQEKFGA